MKPLKEIVLRGEDWLMARILQYAIRRDYAKYTSTLTESWRLSISGLSASLLAAIDSGREDLGLDPDEDYRKDPAAAFGIEEARLHRERGVDIGMFLGLLKYYRESYLDLLRETGPAETAAYRDYVHRFFDRMEIGLCSEWTRGGGDDRILELQAANRRMTNEKNKFLTLFESLASPVILLDTDRRVDHLNWAAAELLNILANRYYAVSPTGCTPPGEEEIRGLPLARLLPEVDAEIQDFSGQKEAGREFELTLSTETGVRHFQVRVSAMQDVSRKFTGLLVIFNDETPLRNTEKRLREARDAAEGANRAKSEFLASMSHELRTPLNAILGFSQLLAGQPTLSPNDREQLGLLHRSGEHLLALINQVLDFSKIEAGRMTVEAAPFDLRRMVGDIGDLFNLKAREKALRLTVETGEDVPRWVSADEVKLRQILINLLGNAVKFTDAGGVALSVQWDPAPSPRLLLAVSDSGIGMSPRELEMIFEPFAQASSRAAGLEGTGLGLAITGKFVQMMGGEISVESRPGEGSCFRVSLPVKPSRRAARSIPGSERIPERLAPGQPEKRLLVVDDSPENRALMMTFLAPYGLEIREAGNGEEALKVWREWRPHLVWMDMRMPVMSGFEASKRIRESGADTVIVAVTASVFEEERAEVFASGCDDYLRKPYRLAALVKMLEKHLGLRFVYPDRPQYPEPAQAETPEGPLWEQMAGQPPERLQSLAAAIRAVNPDRIRQIVNEIGRENPEAERRITEELSEFRYEAILENIAAALAGGKEPPA
jgi:signal transduction histidine kinase/DNA-binding NarL/FixJ family response regulator